LTLASQTGRRIDRRRFCCGANEADE